MIGPSLYFNFLKWKKYNFKLLINLRLLHKNCIGSNFKDVKCALKIKLVVQ